ncbi:hypothetical protein MKW98_007112 [Papaver atlanticum]|uniref:RING-type domain-containing protein n=1 Tax=Papaver atlanticum TaxID=357466 RepID=A0AAD4SMZ9_9MAGN|nr:hypothetical protein MKW98_007112 [Papaver atlanticum]
MDYLEGHLCAHIAFTCSCDAGYYTLTPPNGSAEENNPSLPNKLEVLFRSSHNQIEDGTAITVSSTRTERIDVIENFKSCSLVIHKIVSILSDLKVPERCFDYVTDRILDSVSQIPAESLGGTYCVTACVMITFEENLDVGVTESMEEGVTESMEEDNVRRIPAAKSFINGLNKEEYRHKHGENKDCSSGTTSCAVCFEGILDGSAVSSMPCSHTFHYDCLVTWLDEINSCPVCRCQVEPAE